MASAASRPKLDRALLEALESNPGAEVHLIVRTRGKASHFASRLAEKGLTVRHIYEFINAAAVSGSAGAALKLPSEDWVLSIEEDKPVRALS